MHLQVERVYKSRNTMMPIAQYLAVLQVANNIFDNPLMSYLDSLGVVAKDAITSSASK